MAEQTVVRVAAGVVIRDNLYYVTRRGTEQHQGGKWEFPGGKIEAGETPHEALYRELKEEINIEVATAQPLQCLSFDYGDKQVELHFFIVDHFLGEPASLEGLDSQWVDAGQLGQLQFPDANRAIIAQLQSRE